MYIAKCILERSWKNLYIILILSQMLIYIQKIFIIIYIFSRTFLSRLKQTNSKVIPVILNI